MFISILKIFCCLLLLGKIFTLNLQYLTIVFILSFIKYKHFMIFILSHTPIQCVILTTNEVALILHIPGKDDVCIDIGSRDKV